MQYTGIGHRGGVFHLRGITVIIILLCFVFFNMYIRAFRVIMYKRKCRKCISVCDGEIKHVYRDAIGCNLIVTVVRLMTCSLQIPTIVSM